MNKKFIAVAMTVLLPGIGLAQQQSEKENTSDSLKTNRNQKVNVIDRNQMNNRNQVTNPLDAIRGRVAGLQIERNGGNAMSAVRLRGTSSLTGANDPLIIVDGVMGDLTLLQSIYPTDIESFAILKDASETAQYGSRGAAGVIDIKTARGKSGALRISYNSSFDVAAPYKRLKMLSADGYRNFANERGLQLVDLGYNTNFQKEIERTAFTHQHHLAFAGGTDKSNYRVSLGYMNEQEVIKGIGDRSFMANMNMTQLMWDDLLRIDVGMFASSSDEDMIYDDQKLFYSAAAWNPTFPNHKNSNGSWDGYPSASQINNPLALLDLQNHNTVTHMSTHAKLTFQLLPELALKLFGAYSYDNNELMRFLPTSITTGGEAKRQTSRSEAKLASATLSFNKKLGLHNIQASAFAEIQDEKKRGFGVVVTDIAKDYLDYDNIMGGATRPWDGTTSFYEHPSTASFMGTFGYTFNDRYTLNATLRADGSSKFGKNNRWGYFPSVSASWDLGKEDFIKNLNVFDALKINTGIGWAGNQNAIDSYTAQHLLSPSGITPTGTVSLVTFSELRNANPDLKWEVARTFNLGFDAQFFKNRLMVSANYYYTKVTDMIYPYTVSVPPFKYPKLVANMGSMEKSGLELSIGGTPLVTPDMQLTINANLSLPKDKLISLSGSYNGDQLLAPAIAGIASMNGAGFHGSEDITYQVVGEPLGVFYLPQFTGFFINDDGTKEYMQGESRIAGQATPKALLGSNISFRYKDFDITLQANGAFGHKIFNGTALSYMDVTLSPLYNMMEDAPGMNIASQKVTDYWLESGDYLNIDYITVGWQVPVPRNKFLESMRLSLTMNNVVTFTKYSGLTPMINSSNVNGTLGLDDKRTYPLYHSWTLGVTMNF